ncbi:MAG: hypothetical protein ABSF74_03615 [Dehalococcoidia bacterium]|jgi:hypothetical protein
MKPRNTASILVLTIVLLSAITMSCAAKPQVTYDPNKSYAAVIAIDLPSARATIDDIRQKSAVDGFEVGPVEFYQPGDADFITHINKITSQAHVALLWIASGIEDVPGIQEALVNAGYSGQTRLVPVSGAVPYHH